MKRSMNLLLPLILFSHQGLRVTVMTISLCRIFKCTVQFVTFLTLNENSLEDIAGNLNLEFSKTLIYADTLSPSVILSDTDADDIQ